MKKRRGYRIEWWRTKTDWIGKRVLRLKSVHAWRYYTHIICIDNGQILWTSQSYTTKRRAVGPAEKFAKYLSRLSGGRIGVEIVEID